MTLVRHLRFDAQAGGVAPTSTPAAREVDQLVRRIARALSSRSGDHRLENAQRHLRDEIAQSPRYLFGSPPWCRHRQWALVRFDRVVAHVQRTEAA